jgi:hypothetical protein
MGRRLRWFRRRPLPGIGAKIELRDGEHTIGSLRDWLNAFFFGFRLAWLSPSPLGVIDGLDLTEWLSVKRSVL